MSFKEFWELIEKEQRKEYLDEVMKFISAMIRFNEFLHDSGKISDRQYERNINIIILGIIA